MNDKAIFEIADAIIRVGNRLSWAPPFFKKLSAEEIINTEEYKQFRKRCPELCKLAEEGR